MSIADIRLTHFDREVYEPAEDSYMLADALKDEWENVEKGNPSICLEIGCGTGYVICSAALLIQGNGVCFATDVNPQAAAATRMTLAAHGVHAEVVVGDLLAGMEKRLAGKVDVLLFNPPYVPTPDEEVWSGKGEGGITASWAGGDRGRVVIDRVLPLVNDLLSPSGILLMVLVHDNDPPDVANQLRLHGLDSKLVLTRDADEEKLHIMKVWRSPPPP
mmetsp:Transcript_19785/g.43253  ORF Transcript_19785/g.43253 Transcript_19785/m.43253 type:complete len:218 (-) Transcript_19785:678-1331(-)